MAWKVNGNSKGWRKEIWNYQGGGGRGVQKQHIVDFMIFLSSPLGLLIMMVLLGQEGE